jgi:hypothetical protein
MEVPGMACEATTEARSYLVNVGSLRSKNANLVPDVLLMFIHPSRPPLSVLA